MDLDPGSLAAKIDLLAGAATSEEAAAALKQVLAELGYDSEVELATPTEETSGKGGSGLHIRPSAAPSWTVSLAPQGGSASSRDEFVGLLAAVVCETFGLAVARIEAAERTETLAGSLQEATSLLHHNVRTPITSIAGMAQTLRMRDSLAEEIKTEFLERIEKSAEAIADITDEFRARLDALLRVAASPRQALDLEEIFEGALQRIRDTGAEVVRVTEAGRPLTLLGPRQLLEDAFMAIAGHVASVTSGKVVAALREEVASARTATDGPETPTARAILKAPAPPTYEIPEELAKVWVPEGALIADDQPEKLARPYHLLEALGGQLEVYEESGDVVFEILVPMRW